MATLEQANEILLPKLRELGIWAILVHAVPEGDEDWVCEVTLDGDESICRVDYVDLALYGSPLDNRFVFWHQGVEGKYCLSDKEIMREYKKIVAKSREVFED